MGLGVSGGKERLCERQRRLTLRLAGLEENVGDNLVDLANELEERVIRQVLEGEFTLGSVSRVLRVREGYLGWKIAYSLSEDGVAVTGDDLAALEGGPNVLGDLLVGSTLTDLRSHLLDPSEDLLVGKTKVSRILCQGHMSRPQLTRGGVRRDR